jgi:hypothetical protein
MNGLIAIGVGSLLLVAGCGHKREQSSPVPACIDVSAHVATLTIDEALLKDDSPAVSDVLVELRTTAKFVFGKSIEASCRQANLGDGSLRCVALAKGAADAARCEAAAPMVTTAREAIARRIAGKLPTIAPSPGGTDCASFAEHLVGLADIKPESRDDVRLAVGLGCSNGEYTEEVLACVRQATTILAADACDPTHGSLEPIPNMVPQRRPEVQPPGGGAPAPHEHEHPGQEP